MSATLGGGLGDRVRALMAEAQGLEEQPAEEEEGQGEQQGGVPLVLSEGRSYPVRTVYMGRPGGYLGRGLQRAGATCNVLDLEVLRKAWWVRGQEGLAVGGLYRCVPCRGSLNGQLLDVLHGKLCTVYMGRPGRCDGGTNGWCAAALGEACLLLEES